MKKKIALALATILALSALPMTIFAGSDNRISKDIQVVGKKAAFYYGTSIPPGIPGNKLKSYFREPDYRKEVDAGQVSEATELVFTVKDNITSGSAFRLRLTNAQWMFTAISNLKLEDLPTGYVEENGSGMNTGSNFVSMIDESKVDDKGGAFVADGKNVFHYTDGIMNTNSAADVVKVVNNGEALDYTIAMNPNKPEEATITFNEFANPTSSGKVEVRVPLVITIYDENVDASVQLVDNTSAVSVGSFAIASTKSGSTTNTVRSIKSGRETIDLDTVILKENRVGSLKAKGAFEIEAPQGYQFQNKPDTWTYGYESGLGGLGSIAYVPTYKTENESYALFFQGNIQSSATSSVNIPGAITISGIKLEPVDDDNIPVGSDLEMITREYEFDTRVTANGNWIQAYKDATAANTANGLTGDKKLDKLGVSAGKFKVAKAVDWKMSFKTDGGTVPTLVAGRLNPNRADSDVHKSVKVVFEEEEVSAWLANRTTTFTLPEGVKIRGINWDAQTNLKSVTKSSDILGRELDGKATTPYNLTQTKYTDGKGLTVGENYFTLKDIQTETNGGENGGKMKLSFNLMLSIEPNYDSDTIELSVGGTAVPEALTPITIAKVEKPITIETKVTDVQIGFQSYKVADITIKETKPGYISKDSTGPSAKLVLSIADYYNDRDVYFAPVKDDQVTITGDIKATLQKTTDGTIAFEVDRPSSSTPAEIHITGLQVKINRSVPYGTYDLVVYGDSVFSNYEDIKVLNSVTDEISPIVGFDTDKDGFIFKDYINVKTEGSNSALKSNVKVQADSGVAIVDGKTVELGIAPMNKNGRIMVPLKFMANVFGIEDNNINWYDGNMFNDPGNRVATITSGSTSVQFKIGSTTYKQFKNGAEVTKPIDQQGTAAFIDPVSNRIFLPFAAMGEAFDILVKWDDASKTAIYNPVQE